MIARLYWVTLLLQLFLQSAHLLVSFLPLERILVPVDLVQLEYVGKLLYDIEQVRRAVDGRAVCRQRERLQVPLGGPWIILGHLAAFAIDADGAQIDGRLDRAPLCSMLQES